MQHLLSSDRCLRSLPGQGAGGCGRSDPAYTVGSFPTTITIRDLPLDEWRFAKSTAGDLADPLLSGLGADAELDGLDNLLEYAFDSEPKLVSLDDAPVRVSVIHPTTLEEHLGLIYKRRKDASNLSYSFELSSGLAAWTSAGSGDLEEISVIDKGDGTETVTVRAPSPVTDFVRRFIRLKIVRISG